MILIRSGNCVFGYVELRHMPNIDAASRQAQGFSARAGTVRLRRATHPEHPGSEVVAVVATNCGPDSSVLQRALLSLLPHGHRARWLDHHSTPEAIALLNWGRRLKHA